MPDRKRNGCSTGSRVPRTRPGIARRTATPYPAGSPAEGCAPLMNIFFDVDDTLVTWDFRLRPHVRDVFEALRDDGHRIYIWSGRGKRWDVVLRYQLTD